MSEPDRRATIGVPPLFEDRDQWLVHLRWIAVGVTLLLIVFFSQVQPLLSSEVVSPLLLVTGVLAASNLVYLFLIHQTDRSESTITFFQIGGDLFLFTILLHFSGGVENPLIFYYLVHVFLAGITLSRRAAWKTVLLVAVFSVTLVGGTLTDMLPHYSLELIGTETGTPPGLQSSFALSVLGSVLVLSCLTAYFTTLLLGKLRDHHSALVQKTRDYYTERERLRRVIDGSGIGLVVFNGDLEVDLVNRRMREWFPEANLQRGQSCPLCSGGETEKKAFWEQNRPDEEVGNASKDYCCLVENVFHTGDTLSREWLHESEEGHTRYFDVTVSPVIDKEGEIIEVVELFREVTEQRRMEEEMQHAERMKTLGKMAAGVAHELGNPLSGFSVRLQRLKRNRDPEFIDETIELLESQVGRMNRLIRDFSGFAQPPETTWTACDLEDMISETVKMLKVSNEGESVDIQVDIPEDFPRFMASRDQLNQVFLNLGLNALEAMPEGGTLDIEARQPSDRVRIKFRDTGKGIPEEEQKDIFTPFYSDKDEGGMGLGLALSHSLIEAHGGDISVESEPGDGTTFTLQFPYQPVPEEERSSQDSEPTKIGDTGA